MGEIEKKIKFNKKPKKNKKIMIKLKKIYDKLRLNDEIESKNYIYKSIKNKKFKLKE